MTHDHLGGRNRDVDVIVARMAPPKRQALKIQAETHELLKELAAHAARHGWSSFGIDREDPPTHSAIMEEALKLLDRQRKEPGKKTRRTKR
jgi:hypothetical protein